MSGVELGTRLVQAIVRVIVRVLYRFRARGLEHIPPQGAAILVCNHISFIDPVIVGAAIRRPVRFVMDHRIYRTPGLHWLFRLVGAIPIAPRHEDPATFDRAFDRIAELLEAGELLCIFPEGKITHTGELNEFRLGIERVLERTPVPVLPMALRGLWGSFFSRKDGAAMRKLPRRFRARVQLHCGPAIPPQHASAARLRTLVLELLGEAPAAPAHPGDAAAERSA